jgi:transcriptional regulator GlxA family with amidase domain
LTDIPRSWGVLLFPAFELIDVFGPLNALQTLSRSTSFNLALISETMDPITTKPITPAMNPFNSSFFPTINPTHTLENAPDLDVLIVPGGVGTRSPLINKTIHYIRDTYPKLQYLITVCTGSLLAAKSGVLDGRNATSNKASWNSTVVMRPQVNWIPHARWTVDGNIWTSSGLSAGIDVTLAFIACKFGDARATEIANFLEYERHTDPSWDPFAKIFGVPGG